MKNIAALCLIILCLTACGHKPTDEQNDKVMFSQPVARADAEPKEYRKNAPVAEKIMDVTMAVPPPIKEGSTVDTSKKITKEGDIHFQTADVVLTRKHIIQNVQKLGGYVFDDNQTKDEGSNKKEYNLKVRVPAKNFDKLLDTVADAADRIDSKNINIKDVTTEYIDTKTRLDNKKKLEDRYLQLLSKANKMSDMLQIEEKLEEIRSDIESTQGQLNYMAKQVAYSSLDITFYSLSVVPQNDNGLGYRFKEALSGGWDFLQSLFFNIVASWPAVIILLLGFIWFKKRKNSKTIVTS